MSTFTIYRLPLYLDGKGANRHKLQNLHCSIVPSIRVWGVNGVGSISILNSYIATLNVHGLVPAQRHLSSALVLEKDELRFLVVVQRCRHSWFCSTLPPTSLTHAFCGPVWQRIAPLRWRQSLFYKTPTSLHFSPLSLCCSNLTCLLGFSLPS